MPTPLLPILFWIGAAAWLGYAIRRILRHLLFFQIEEYDNARFANLLWRNSVRVLTPVEIMPVVVLVVTYILASLWSSPTWQESLSIVFCGLWTTLYVALLILKTFPPAKKPLVLTARATRLLVTGCVLATGLFLAMTGLISGRLFVSQTPPDMWELPLIALWALVVNQAIGWVVIAANVVMYPVEAAFRRYYATSAKRIFDQHSGLRVIAVTGSYGKTSTKEIIAHVLSRHYRVLKTPRSFNTLMGICKVIREDLRPDHDIFVVEMGAYKKGEIDKLCRLTPPHIGVLTAIGPQHLERFETVERVAEAKYELMEHLPPDGTGVFNGDDPRCQLLSERPASFEVRRYGFERADVSLDVRATNITITGGGTEFDVSTSDEVPVHFATILLGQHNVSNILAAVSVAIQCGMTLQETADSVTTLEAVEHRLQRIEGAGGVVVIDDAYNANPAGVRLALEVLDKLPGGRKILITPGMVELGDHEELEHRQMGVLAADTCDYVILVGAKRTRSIADGLQAKDFPADHLAVVQDLDEATRHLQTFVQPGDVVLFENDLPDSYATDAFHF